MKIHSDIEQHSPEWYEIRLGKLTGSDFHILMGNSDTKNNLLYKKAAERITGRACDHDTYKNHHMERGNRLEPEARSMYEVLNLCEVQEVGFIQLGDYLGCSPDGLVGKDGGCEIKSKDNHTFLKAVTKSWIEPAHKTQCHFNMYITGRSWWDYALYNENYTNSLHVIRLPRDEEYISRIKTTIEECETKIQGFINQYNKIS